MTDMPTPREPLGGRVPRQKMAKPPRPAAAGPRRPQRRPFGWLGRVLGVLFTLAVVGAIGAGVVGFVLYKKYSANLPDLDGLRHYQPQVMSRVYASDSSLLSELATERRIFVPANAIPDIVKRAFISAEDQNFYIHGGVDPLAIIRAAVTDALRFGEHRRPVGASTITQQVAKNMLLDNRVTLGRKIREAILAMRIEASMSKDRILELYLNEIYLGLQSYGVAAAAQAYFNESLDQITIPQAAFLAALPKAPNNYNPFRFPEAALARRDWVIDRMAADNVITAAQATAAKATPLAPAPFSRPPVLPGAGYFAEEVRRELVDRFGADQTTQGGLVVRTTLVPDLQKAADAALRDGLMRYDRSKGGWRGPVGHIDPGPAWAAELAKQAPPPGMLASWRLAVVLSATPAEAKLGVLPSPDAIGEKPAEMPLYLSDIAWARPAHADSLGPVPRRIADVMQPGDLVMVQKLAASPAQGRLAARPARLALEQIPKIEGALVSLDPATGRVLAMSGGWSFGLSQYNRATQASRQPGSSFKPYVYLTALERGVSPSQRFLDAPFVVNLGAAGEWRPGNYEMTFDGPVPLHVALEKSLNLVTVRVASEIGMSAIAKTAETFGVVDKMPLVLPAALGAVETTVLRQAAGYATFAEGGRKVVPTLIDSVQDRDGHVIWRAGGPTCQGCNDPARPPEVVDARPEIADPASVYQLVMMMQGVVQHGTGTPAAVGLTNRAIAGKTGTTQDFNDAWFVGYTPDVVTAVWMGFDNPATLGNNETGGALSGPVWNQFMKVALKDRPNLKFAVPPGVTVASWNAGGETAVDAFKPGQVPGASGPVDGVSQPADTAAAQAGAPGGAPHAAGVDSSLGGLY